MSSNTKMGNARFERMTKEEKLRFCQDLIRQAAHLSKPSRVQSTGSKANAPMVRSKSKSSKRGTSVASATSKKTKSVASTRSGRSKSRDRGNLTKPSTSKSSRLSSSSQSVSALICSFAFHSLGLVRRHERNTIHFEDE